MPLAFAGVIAWGVLTLAGQGWAGEGRATAPAADAVAAQQVERQVPVSSPADASARAWMASYWLIEAGSERSLVVVRDADRIEYRMQGEPVRVWHRLADGLEYRELHPQQGRVVVYSPGDLRALGHSPDWAQLHELVAPAVRAPLHTRGVTRFQAHRGQRLQGEVDHARVSLDWLDDAALPARYERRAAGGNTTLILRDLDQVDAANAFTATDELREIDFTDLGDMELDEFASQHIRQGFQAD